MLPVLVGLLSAGVSIYTSARHSGMGRPQKSADLELILAGVHHGCMGLPQELVDHTMDMLHKDLSALKACLLTCRAMFASTRHLIHWILYLIPQNTESRQGSPRNQGSHQSTVGLGVLSCKAERNLLQYTRQVYIRSVSYGYFSNASTFSQDALSPHLHHFQSLDRVYALTIDSYDVRSWADHYKSHFTHFHPTLTTLTLRRPRGDYRLILEFTLQFPNLLSLCLEWPDKNTNQSRPDVTTPRIICRYSPRRL